MSTPTPLDKAALKPAMADLIERSAHDPDYARGLQIFAHKQEVFEPIWAAYVEMLENGKLDRGLKELVRMKIAQNNDCSPYIGKSSLTNLNLGKQAAVPLSADKIAAVASFEVSEVLSQREKLALKFAEKLGIEHAALDDEFFALLRQEFSDAEIVELAHVVAVGIGFERFMAVWKPRACAI